MGGTVEMICTRLVGFLFGGSNAEKWGDHRQKNFFINNYIEPLILLKEGHQAVAYHSCTNCSNLGMEPKHLMQSDIQLNPNILRTTNDKRVLPKALK